MKDFSSAEFYETKIRKLVKKANAAGFNVLHNVTREDGNHPEMISIESLCVIKKDTEHFETQFWLVRTSKNKGEI